MKSKVIKFNSKIGLLKHLPGMHYIEIPKNIIQKLGGTFNARLVCTVNKKIRFQCGLMALGEGKGYVSITKKRLKEASVKLNSEVKIELKLDKSEYGMELPEELDELLKQDPDGMKRFKSLTPGKQRYIIFYVAGVKNSDSRLERAMLIIENLKRQPLGKETFRAMLGK